MGGAPSEEGGEGGGRWRGPQGDAVVEGTAARLSDGRDSGAGICFLCGHELVKGMNFRLYFPNLQNGNDKV